MAKPYDEYKLRCSLAGHKKDVRSLYVVEGGVKDSTLLVSGSRDCTMKTWHTNEQGIEFSEQSSVNPTRQFVSAVCFVRPSAAYPEGYLITGNKDGSLIAFPVDCGIGGGQQLFSLKNHKDNVCTLDTSDCGAIVTGSWDKIACTYVNDTLVNKLIGHEAAIWSVKIMKNKGLVLTASADKTIKVWKDNTCVMTMKGHSDCVRSLSLLGGDEFLSCSNDTTIRRWNVVSGACLKVYYGHTNYVYSVCRLGSEPLFASCGEDGCIRIWSIGEENGSTAMDTGEAEAVCKQTIDLPSQSIWALESFQNGDIAVGSSDSMIRIFSKDACRQTTEIKQKEFQQSVVHSQISNPGGNLDLGKLADVSVALIKPGKKEGEVMMVKDGTTPVAYQWTAGAWLKIGDIVGQNKNKTMYNGKEYDFVFDVDISEGAPTLKLAYNLDEDAWTAAQAFIDTNQLNPVYLDEVVVFIQARVKESGRQSTASVPTSAYQDPFTGTGRYIPDGSSGAGNTNTDDPYTGSGRYIPSDDTSTGNGDIGFSDPYQSGRYQPSTDGAEQSKNLKANEFFPQKNFIFYQESKPAFISEKIEAFNKKLESDLQITIDIDELCAGLTGGIIQQKFVDILMECLAKWPSDKVYPLLDLLRVTMKYDESIEKIIPLTSFRDICSSNIQKESGPNSYLILRAFCNMFEHESGRTYLLNMFDEIVNLIKIHLENSIISKNMETTIASLLINYAVLGKGKEMDLIFSMKELVYIFKNDEARFRLLVTIGTLMINSEVVAISIKGAGFAKFILKCSGDIDSSPKTSLCAKYLSRFV